MTHRPEQPYEIISDIGVEKGAEKLTPERIREVIRRYLEEEGGARLRVYADTCVHCGLCSDACHFFFPMTGSPGFPRPER